MFRNLHFKILSLVLAAIFWLFVVSLENSFVRFGEDISVKAFNVAEGLALVSELGTVRLTLRAQDPGLAPGLSAGDFEAHVDLSEIGAGRARVPVTVVSKNAGVTVARIEPVDLEVELAPVREKNIAIAAEVTGKPAEGFEVADAALSRSTVTVAGSLAILERIGSAKAEVKLTGRERESFSRKAKIKIYDKNSVLLEGMQVKEKDIEVTVTIKKIELPPEESLAP